MAKFDPPFGNAAEFRYPDVDEAQNGFPCGPADPRLFNGMFGRIERELGAVITAAGLTPSDGSMTQVLDSITALINAATGGGELTDYLLLTQARTRLPIFPEVLTLSGKLTVGSPGVGIARLAADQTFTHRGIFNVTTALTDFNTDASKTYHLRWNPTDGYVLKDLASPVYNPTAVAETNAKFDTAFDDMLIARVISNSSNILTVTSLINKDRYTHEGYLPMGAAYQAGPTSFQNSEMVNFSRRPKVALSVVGAIADNYTVAPNTYTDEVTYGVSPMSRYQVGGYYQRYGLLGEGAALNYTAWM